MNSANWNSVLGTRIRNSQQFGVLQFGLDNLGIGNLEWYQKSVQVCYISNEKHKEVIAALYTIL